MTRSRDTIDVFVSVETEAAPPSEPSSVPAEDHVKNQTPEEVSGEGRPAEATDTSGPQTAEVAQVQTPGDQSSPEPVDQPAGTRTHSGF